MIHRLAAVALLVLLVAVAAPARGLDKEAVGPALEGLDALHAGKYADAVAALSRAIDADPESADLWVARGAARALGGDPAAGEADLTRAGRLAPDDRHAKLWLAFTYWVRGDYQKPSVLYPGTSRDPYEQSVADVGRAVGRLSTRRTEYDDPKVVAGWDRDGRAAKAKFGDLAAGLAARLKRGMGDLGPALAERARGRMAAGDWAAALAEIDQAQQTDAADVALWRDRATCLLRLGAPAAAREIYARVLLADPSSAAAYAGRAEAAARLGDAGRAALDLARAARLDPARAAAFRETIQAAMRDNPPAGIARDALPDKVRELQAAAKAGAKDEELIARARAIVRSVNAFRLRADETYFERRLELEERAKAGGPGDLADLAEFLYRDATARPVEQAEPGGPATPYRTRDAAAGLRDAEAACAHALAADDRHVKALTYLAACRMARLRWDDARAPLAKAMSIDPTYGPLLDTTGGLLSHAAAVRAARAGRLRQTTTWEDAKYYYYRQPSPDEVARADDLDREAADLWELSRKNLEAAARLHADKAEGFYYAGVLATNLRKPDVARTAFEQCVKMDPAYGPAWDELAVLYAIAGMGREAAEAKSRSVNLVHTTAGHMVRFAGACVPRARYKSAREALARAIEFDPADARACAYLGVLAAAEGRPDDAAGWYRAAAALDEVRLTFEGVGMRSPGTSPVSAEAAAFTLAVGNRLGDLELSLGHADRAAEAYARGAALERRIPRDQWFVELPAATLPEPEIEPGELPAPPAAVSLLMDARAGLGAALAKLGRKAEATAQARAVLALAESRRPTEPPAPRTAVPYARAKMAIIRAALDANDVEAAWAELMRQSGAAGGGRVPKEVEQEFRQLGDEVQRRRMESFDRENQAPQPPFPDPPRRRRPRN